ncbi:lipase 3-like [Hyposmocoma kahamanoa]|uniref:lipase 3-like n=1 Tax=Hyposmocoma kahamanoa TaxID=1477025 RepID=UPI000E6DA3CB|nr:lipase 3-like [Hyposmocoma kahamanoa]
MKLPVFVIITFLIIQTAQCEQDWIPKLSNVIDIVRHNLRTIGYNIRTKILAYFNDSDTSTPPNYTLSKEKFAREMNEYSRVSKSPKESGKVTKIFQGPVTSKKTLVKEAPYIIQETKSLLEEKPSLEEERIYLLESRDTQSPLQETTTATTSSPAPERTVKRSSEDPYIHFTTPQLIVFHGYSVETHTVLTDDGYFLTVHRIPFSKKNPKKLPEKTVLLHHGLLGSSADWIITGPKKALAYILSDAGYDVWLANARGNTYSRSHVSLSTDSFAFWNFTFHDIAQHDLPAVIDHIMYLKGWDIKINYIGHSMGTTILFSLLSTKEQYNKILRAGFALAPVAYMSDVRSPIRYLAKISNSIELMMKILGQNEFLPQSELIKIFARIACEISPYEEAICENAIFYLCGFDEKQFNRTLLPIILAHEPAGASTRTLIHYAQEIHNNGRFQQYDYGPMGNMRQYGTLKPPEYEMKKVTLPIALLSAENDWLSGDVDVTRLFVQLANPIEHYIVPLKEFNHVDFLWAIDAPVLVYNKLLHLMEEGISHYGVNEIVN